MSRQSNRGQMSLPGKLPIAVAEDVEFSTALADEDDREAQSRAASADRRAREEDPT